MSKNNLLKAGYFMVESEGVRTIDSNERFEKKVGYVPVIQNAEAKPYILESFDNEGEAPISEDGLALLFGEEQAGDYDADAYESGDGYQEDESGFQEMDLASAQVLEDAHRQAEQILLQAQQQADEIIANAQVMGEQNARMAYEEAAQKGQQDGYREGYQKATQEGEQLKAELAAQAQELAQEYQQKIEEIEPDLVNALTGIYEHIFHVEFAEHRNVLQHLLTNTLRSVEASGTYMIHVSSEDYSFVSMQKAQIIEDGNLGKNATVEVIEDISLTKNQCLIETENGIFDCSLSAQLEELKRKLLLLSYTG